MQLLPAIRRIDGDVFVSKQDSALTHLRPTGRSSVHYDNPFINPDMWPANSSDLHLVCRRMMQQRAYQVNPGCGEIESAIC